jgi:hypothetical protein
VKVFTSEAMDAIQSGAAIVTGAVEIACDPSIRLWGGFGPIEIDGDDYAAIGDRGVAQVSNGALGAAAQGITLILSGIEPDALEVLEADEIHDAPVKLLRLIFDSSGTRMLDWHVFTRGRVDQVTVDDVIGGTATIVVSVESQAKGLGRKGGRMRTDADQRLIDPNDGFFKNVSYAGQKQLYWGGQRPATAASALGGNVVPVVPSSPTGQWWQGQ